MDAITTTQARKRATMFSFAAAATDHYQGLPVAYDYYSVEFGLNGSHPVYQFKLWHSDGTPHFFLLKDTSDLVALLKVGDILPMKYYCNDTPRTIERHHTRIEDIVNEKQGRFKGYFRIKLDILGNDKARILLSTGSEH